MEVKCGRAKYDLTTDDVIMYNGACYQIVTREVRSGWYTYPPILAKGTAAKLIKAGALIEVGKDGNLQYFKIASKEVTPCP